MWNSLPDSTTLSSLLDKHAPIVNKLVNKLSRRQSPSNPWFTATLRAFRSTLRQAENIWKRTHSAADWSSFKSLRNQYHKLILSSKKEYYSSLVSSASNNPKRLWLTVSKLLHRKSSSPRPTTSPGTSLADSFASFFHWQNIQTPPFSHQPPCHIISALTVSSCHSP